VQEIEQKLVAVEVKKPVVIKDVRKVKKTQYVKQPTAPATNQRSGTVRVPGTYFLADFTNFNAKIAPLSVCHIAEKYG
jgi:hypothetical protein